MERFVLLDLRVEQVVRARLLRVEQLDLLQREVQLLEQPIPIDSRRAER